MLYNKRGRIQMLVANEDLYTVSVSWSPQVFLINYYLVFIDWHEGPNEVQNGK